MSTDFQMNYHHNKTFYMLPNGSLSTISRLLGSESARQEGERA